MEIVGHAVSRSQPAVSGYDRRIVLAYTALAIVALAAVYFASGGPGLTKSELAIATILP
jgi:hypothetical protein